MFSAKIQHPRPSQRWSSRPYVHSWHTVIRLSERKLLQNVLNETGGNKADAARRLGIQRRLLYEKMKALGMESSE
ncbi:hypothetical protein H7849_01540 [Alloacidobacterium dinghuense]|uniref:DNA binding HTH domain-containing protein n=1 Tax=Alloacidobacterium dinghuense TaxID=2763107 RepID=A0A7G8BQA7_9BACT|nr:hypothetical protein H7849_01540 [Alloacidobacterium dinghuense]